jgi:hypothetical protein
MWLRTVAVPERLLPVPVQILMQLRQPILAAHLLAVLRALRTAVFINMALKQ